MERATSLGHHYSLVRRIRRRQTFESVRTRTRSVPTHSFHLLQSRPDEDSLARASTATQSRDRFSIESANSVAALATWRPFPRLYQLALAETRFLGIGNPSESGTHLLYYFRQENQLAPSLFVHPHELFDKLRENRATTFRLKRLIFLDDFCGSGTQACRYSRRLLPKLRRRWPNIGLSYLGAALSCESAKASFDQP